MSAQTLENLENTAPDPTPGTVVVELDASASLAELTELVTGACDRAEDGSEHGALILRLTAGTDDGWPADLAVHQVNRWERAVRRIERLGALTMTVADGTLTGPLVDVFLAADHRIAGTRLRLVLRDRDGLPWPGMTLYRLAHQLGVARARRVLLAASVDATEAHTAGLADEITSDPDRPWAALAELAPARGPEFAVRRRLLLEATTTTFEEAIGPHLAACDRVIRRRGQAFRED
ncbi:enoyl-CoA-hydratase DpgB [Streptomyces sp. NPDC090798]|uniref:enoyl-CoA-hydratase DpgB n=1 Tax=Streptomyces sp. NPDC090798 TaxID=3365968 RepID=UPI0038004E6E